MQVRVLDDVITERLRQDRLKRTGKFEYTCADAEPKPSQKLAILAEEFGEVAREVCVGLKHPINNPALYNELIQVAAVCVAWCECLQKERSCNS